MPRTGYVLEGVADPERVSSHCYGVVLITMLLSKLVETVDVEKALKMAIIHDLPESLIGDLTPHSSHFIDKKNAEIQASNDVFAKIYDLDELFLEYIANETVESKIVHDADKLQMMARVHRYRRQGKGDMDRFKDVEFYFSESADILKEFKRLDGYC